MYMRVHVLPDARRERVIDDADGSLTIAVREPALGNRANDRVRQIVAARLQVPVRSVRILTGHRGPSKLLSIDN